MQELGFLQYKFIDSNRQEIDLNILNNIEEKNQLITDN
jgi:hypothetical protein